MVFVNSTFQEASFFKITKVCPIPHVTIFYLFSFLLYTSLLLYSLTVPSITPSLLVFFFFLVFSFYPTIRSIVFLLYSTGIFYSDPRWVLGVEKFFQVWGKNFQTPNLIPVESLISACIDQNGSEWAEISLKVE